MLAYTFGDLQIEDYKEVSSEEFDNVLDLLSRIIVGRLNRLIKQGFFRDYVRKSETSSSIRGKINLAESIKTLSLRKKQLNFSYNEYSINNYLNQIIKTSLLLFIKSDINETTENNDNDKEKRSELLEKMIVVLEELINYSDAAKNSLHSVKYELKLLKDNK